MTLANRIFEQKVNNCWTKIPQRQSNRNTYLPKLEELNLIVAGSGDMPHLTIEVACTPAQLTEIETKRSALQATANAGDLAAIDQLAAETHLRYALADTKKGQ